MANFKIVPYEERHGDEIVTFGMNDKLMEIDASFKENRLDIALPGLSYTLLNDNNPVTPTYVSSKKMKRQTRMISWTKNSLKECGQIEKLEEMDKVLKNALGLTQRKRSYTSDYGYGNVREVLLGEQDKLIPGPNWDKFYLENIIKWWKKKAGKRYEKMKKEGRFRTEVELWTEDQDIQIIR